MLLVNNNVSLVDHKCIIRVKTSQIKMIRWELPKDLRESARLGYDVYRVPRTPLSAYEVAMSHENIMAGYKGVIHAERQFVIMTNPLAQRDQRQRHPTRFHAKNTDYVEVELIKPHDGLDMAAAALLRSPYQPFVFANSKGLAINKDTVKKCLKKPNIFTFYTTKQYALDIRFFLEERGYRIKDSMYERQGLGVFFKKIDEFIRRAKHVIEVGRSEGMTDYQIAFSTNRPLRTYVISRLCEMGSKLYTPCYMHTNEKYLSHKGAELSEAQYEQMLDAYYWTYLAPVTQRIDFENVISFYDSIGYVVRLKCPHMVHGQSVGRTSSSARLRRFKNIYRALDFCWLDRPPIADDEWCQACVYILVARLCAFASDSLLCEEMLTGLPECGSHFSTSWTKKVIG